MTDRRHSRDGWNPTALPEALIWLRDANTGEDENLATHQAEAHATGDIPSFETLAASDCECAASWLPGTFAPCDGDYGIQACDGCNVHGDDFDTAYAIAAALTEKTGRTFEVWYEAEPVIFTSEAPRYLVRRWGGIVAERGFATEEDARAAAMFWTGSHIEEQHQYNQPNAILVAIRTIMREDGVRGPLSSWYADAATYLTGGTQALGLPILPGMADHARRVLIRLARLAELEPML